MNGVTWPSDSRVSVSFSVWHVGAEQFRPDEAGTERAWEVLEKREHLLTKGKKQKYKRGESVRSQDLSLSTN